MYGSGKRCCVSKTYPSSGPNFAQLFTFPHAEGEIQTGQLYE